MYTPPCHDHDHPYLYWSVVIHRHQQILLHSHLFSWKHSGYSIHTLDCHLTWDAALCLVSFGILGVCVGVGVCVCVWVLGCVCLCGCGCWDVCVTREGMCVSRARSSVVLDSLASTCNAPHPPHTPHTPPTHTPHTPHTHPPHTPHTPHLHPTYTPQTPHINTPPTHHIPS